MNSSLATKGQSDNNLIEYVMNEHLLSDCKDNSKGLWTSTNSTASSLKAYHSISLSLIEGTLISMKNLSIMTPRALLMVKSDVGSYSKLN